MIHALILALVLFIATDTLMAQTSREEIASEPNSYNPNVSRVNSIELNEAYSKVREILTSDNQCSRFFGGREAIRPLTLLVSRLKPTIAPAAVGIHMFGSSSVFTESGGRINYRVFEHEDLNLRGAFFNAKRFPDDPPVPRIGSFNPATPEARALMLLHELGHMVDAGNGWLLPDDGGNAAASAENTERVENECRAQFKAFAVRVKQRKQSVDDLNTLKN